MTVTFDPTGVERFRDLIARRLGLQFEDGKLAFLGEVLERRADARGQSSTCYLAELETSRFDEERGRLAEELTVGETYFFRNNDQFRALSEVVLPARLAARAASRQIRLLSAGCASGEEAYSLAMTFRQTVTDPNWQAIVRAVDINPASLAKAAKARYSSWALRETPAAVRERWFTPAGRDLVLNDEARQAVQFSERNLAVDDAELWAPETYDAIFCRNVIMYFTPAVARSVMARIERSLVRGGYLFLGHAETLRGLSHGFHLVHTHDTFYYQRKLRDDEAARVSEALPAAPFVHAGGPSPNVPAAASDGLWYEAINKASDRIAALTRQKAASPAAPMETSPAWSLGVALDLLQRERYGDALDLVGELPAEAGGDPDVLLLRAVLLVHAGQLVAAAETCRRLLAAEELNAGANYVLALCAEAAGDRAVAADHYRVASYLAPAFAMPRLHLGLLARRSGDNAAAERELRQALLLLAHEDTSRLLLFGGGFTREALIAMCEAELRRAGGRP